MDSPNPPGHVPGRCGPSGRNPIRDCTRNWITTDAVLRICPQEQGPCAEQRCPHRTPPACVAPVAVRSRLHARRLERFGGFFQVYLHFVPQPPAREVRGLDDRQYLCGAVSMSAGASLVRACMRASGGASPEECSIRSSASSSAASPTSSALSSSVSSSPATSTTANVSLALPNATRNRSMAVRGSCSRSPATSVSPWAARRVVPATRRRPRRGTTT